MEVLSMTANQIYGELVKLQKLAWKDDDMMSQDTRFDVQDSLAELLLKVAVECGKTEDLVKTFPWLYRAS